MHVLLCVNWFHEIFPSVVTTDDTTAKSGTFYEFNFTITQFAKREIFIHQKKFREINFLVKLLFCFHEIFVKKVSERISTQNISWKRRHTYTILGVPATSWILLADSQRLSFSTLIMKPISVFWSDKPPRALDAQDWPSLPGQQSWAGKAADE